MVKKNTTFLNLDKTERLNIDAERGAVTVQITDPTFSFYSNKYGSIIRLANMPY